MAHPRQEIVDAIDRCGAETGETRTVEREIPVGRDDDGGHRTEVREIEQAVRCDGRIGREHYAGMRHAEDYEGKVHAFKCPECGTIRHVCPVCTGAPGGPGYFRGESTGAMLACHVCNPREYARQQRDPHFPP